VQAETPPIEVPLEPSANGISYGAGGNGWETHENGSGSHYETESPAAEPPLASKRPLEQDKEEAAEQQEAKRVREDDQVEQQQQGGEDEEEQVEHHGEKQQQQVVPSPQLPIHTGGD
jgi:hypothetical protein